MKRLTFICHNVQHLAKSQYYLSSFKEEGDWYEINLIWNLFTMPLEGPFASGYDRVFQFSNSPLYNKLIMPFTQQGRFFSLRRALPGYEDQEIEEFFYIFSDEMFNVIKIFDSLDRCRNKKYHVTLLDEGLGLYERNVSHYPLTIGKIYRQIAGMHIPSEMYIGWDPRVTRIIAQHPELLPEHKIKGRIIEQEPDIWGDTAFWHEWIMNNLDKDVLQSVKNKEVLYLGTCDETLVYESDIIMHLVETYSHEKIVVKVHPRTEKVYRDNLTKVVDVITAPSLNMLPAELLIGHVFHPQIIFTYSSSSLSSIAERFPDIMCCYLFGVYDPDNISYEKLKDDERRLPNVKCLYSYECLADMYTI